MNDSNKITGVYEVDCTQCTESEFDSVIDYFDSNSFFITEPHHTFTAYWNTSTPANTAVLPGSCKITLIQNQFES